ncbi:peptidoglycan editing factor PgeF [Aquirufa sp. HETE-83D]|uniref:Purine nucleoside phosphorylase n=1 Tax=Aquirufa esocilacus TaxID=3096513 RepID=A0ABW6DHX5_9BACT
MTPSRFVRPTIFQSIPGLVAGVSTRHGGLSEAPYASLNVGVHTDDDPAVIEQNLSLFCTDLGISPVDLARSYQVHGDKIWVTGRAGYQSGFDAMVSVQPGVFAGVGIADCTPILLADPVTRVCAAIHAGWKGTVAQIVHKTAKRMMENRGSNPADILAYIGPCISLAHFEVGNEVAAQFDSAFKTRKGAKWHVDLKAANAAQLQALGIQQIEIDSACTVENNADFFSHRTEKGVTGRMLALIGFQVT